MPWPDGDPIEKPVPKDERHDELPQPTDKFPGRNLQQRMPRLDQRRNCAVVETPPHPTAQSRKLLASSSHNRSFLEKDRHLSSCLDRAEKAAAATYQCRSKYRAHLVP